MSQTQAKLVQVNPGARWVDGGTRMTLVDPTFYRSHATNYSMLIGSRDPKSFGEHDCVHEKVRGLGGDFMVNGDNITITPSYSQQPSEFIEMSNNTKGKYTFHSGINEFLFTLDQLNWYWWLPDPYVPTGWSMDYRVSVDWVKTRSDMSIIYLVLEHKSNNPSTAKITGIPMSWVSAGDITSSVRASGYFIPYITSDGWCDRLVRHLSITHSIPYGLESEVFREACNAITINTNNIANAISIVDLVRDIYKFKVGDLLKRLNKTQKVSQMAASAWLQHRYVITTTLMDIEEITAKYPNFYQYPDGRNIGRGGQTTDVGTMRCKVIYTDLYQNQMAQLFKKLKRTGLAPDLMNAWDLVPFSFVADWFVPIGDILGDLSSNWVAIPGYFNFNSITTSWKWTERVSSGAGSYNVTSYSRTVTHRPPSFESYSTDPSNKTIMKRWIDGAALLIGR